jgi:hypothetical protein
MIYFLINRCAVQIKIKIYISSHGSLDGLCLIHVKLLEYVTCILCLANEKLLFGLLDLKSKKECEDSYQRHFKPIHHNFAKLFTKEFVSRAKDNTSTYICHINKSFPIFLVKRVESVLPILKPFSIRKSLMHLYHALGACLSP